MGGDDSCDQLVGESACEIAWKFLSTERVTIVLLVLLVLHHTVYVSKSKQHRRSRYIAITEFRLRSCISSSVLVKTILFFQSHLNNQSIYEPGSGVNYVHGWILNNILILWITSDRPTKMSQVNELSEATEPRARFIEPEPHLNIDGAVSAAPPVRVLNLLLAFPSI